MIKNIIFDLGGVLVDWNPRYMYNTLFETKEAMEYFLELVCTSKWNEEQDGGRSLQDGTEILIKEFPEYEFEIRAFYNRWTEMLRGSIQGTVDILNRLQDCNKYKLLALTNWAEETFPIALERYKFLSKFEDILVSGVEKLKKPDPKIYHMLLDRNKILASESLFIDDNYRNIESAQNVGLEVIHFINPEQLHMELKKLNLI